ncbi:hypothetical protein BTN49_1401 [Candidatus Enterovibrio escicola]|uniref:Uncharacterized protein n=1 Tax=Candidatus Enterovibrio escicola TaxID=1927127 RepID=A0A2A5T402_9GAMM|nr:hypothetical protein BTN49_1401 [Candidatus Enterovibrio escacola]
MRLFELKKLTPHCVTTFPLDVQEVVLICEVDKQWSFVDKKNTRVSFGILGSLD